jgi:hypothetical protein
MGPDNLCKTHSEQLAAIRLLAEAIHCDRLPGWYASLPGRLDELVAGLERFSSCYGCCRPADRLGELLCSLLTEIYREQLPTAHNRAIARNLRRPAYDLSWLVRGLCGAPSVVMLGLSRPYGLELEAGSRLDRFLSRHGEDISLVPASMGLGAFIAYQRGIEPYSWSSYAVSVMDETLLRLHGPSLRTRRFGSRPLEWVAEHPAARYPVLERLGWLDELSPQARHTVSGLIGEWDGSIEDLINASVHLS